MLYAFSRNLLFGRSLGETGNRSRKSLNWVVSGCDVTSDIPYKMAGKKLNNFGRYNSALPFTAKLFERWKFWKLSEAKLVKLQHRGDFFDSPVEAIS